MPVWTGSVFGLRSPIWSVGPGVPGDGPGVIDCDGVSGLLGFRGFTVSPWLAVEWQRVRLWTGSDFMV